jgi:nucleotide-binding universal stress UspA family protein
MGTVTKKILFCSDLTKRSVQVFKQAVALAMQTDASISMVHVVPKEDAAYKGEFIDWMDQELYDRIRKGHEAKAKNVLIDKQKGMTQIQDALREYFEQTGKNKAEHQQIAIDAIEVMEGSVAFSIPEFAAANGCDLIVMGYHQEGTFLNALMEGGGEILRRNRINILIVPVQD